MDALLDDVLATKIAELLDVMCDVDPQCSPEVIANSIECGESFFYIHSDGFSVLTPHKTKLHVWVGCAWDGSCNLMSGITDILVVAKQLKLPKVTFKSPRKGWQRVAHKYGFHLIDGFYTIEV